MSVSRVIIISGPPCTGKTTLSKKIAKVFLLPVISCDSIRESLYDSFGCFDLTMFEKIRTASFLLMYDNLESLLSCKYNLVIDSTFWSGKSRVKIEKLQKLRKFKCLQINLGASGKILWDRYQERTLSGHRHPGYLDHLRRKELKRKITKGFSTPPKTKGKIIKIDTTDFKKIEYKKLLKIIKLFLTV
ncbi:MAG: AAA family ATPase [Candidatus Paceibacterota bacterium]